MSDDGSNKMIMTIGTAVILAFLVLAVTFGMSDWKAQAPLTAQLPPDRRLAIRANPSISRPPPNSRPFEHSAECAAAATRYADGALDRAASARHGAARLADAEVELRVHRSWKWRNVIRSSSSAAGRSAWRSRSISGCAASPACWWSAAPSCSDIPKGQNLTQRTLEHFYFWGIVDELRAARVMPPGYPIGEVTAYGNLMSEYWHAPPAASCVRAYYFQDNERLPQYQTEKVLRAQDGERCRTSRARFGWTATTVEQDDDGVRVTIVDEGRRARDVLEADYVVGCDGGHSLVREQVGIARGGTDFDQLMVLAVFRSRELHEGLEALPRDARPIA